MFSKYYERGLAVIPILPRSKFPVADAKGFDHWAVNGQPPELIEMFEQKYPTASGFGVAVLCGPHSNIAVVDVDTRDPDVVSACPISPVIRRGNPERFGAIFMRYNSDVLNKPLTRKLEDGTELRVDILCLKRYIIIPPAIHEKGFPYEWVTPDTLDNFDAKDLPLLTQDHLNKIAEAIGYSADNILFGAHVEMTGTFVSPDGVRCAHGSHDRIKCLVAALIAKGTPINEAIYELIQYDETHHHGVRFFNDPRASSDFGADPISNALKMYGNILKTINQNHLRKGEPVELPSGLGSTPTRIEIALDVKAICTPNFKAKKFPEARGVMKKFIDYCEVTSSGKQDSLGLGGAISLLSVLCSNRFNTEVRGLTTCSNVYVMNIAPSGFGKETAQRLVYDLLAETDDTLLGGANYRSGSSILMNLVEQQERIDIVDECSTLLKAMGGKEDYKSEIAEVLSLLYSKANSKFMGFSSLASGNKFGECWNPCVSMLGSTTPAGFRGSVNKDMAAKGLLPRFFLFIQSELGAYKGRQSRARAPCLNEEIKNFMAWVLAIPKEEHPEFKPKGNLLAKKKGKRGEDLSEGIRYKPAIIPMTDAAHEYWLEYDEECHNKKAEDPDGFESAFVARFAEKATKLALLDAVSLGRAKIELDSVQWAREVVEVEWHNARPVYELASAENRTESDYLRVLKFIEKEGMIKQSSLSRSCRWLDHRQFTGIIKQMLDQGQIELVDVKTPGKTGPAARYCKLLGTVGRDKNGNLPN